MTASFAPLRLADTVLKVGRVHSFDEGASQYRSLAIRDGVIVGASEQVDGLDALCVPGTKVLDQPELTVMPALFDTHEHLLESARNLGRVPAQDARSLDELIAMIAERAGGASEGEWIQTSMGWSESNLAEQRLPTASELDRASETHPVLVPRGGHVCVANSLALREAGVTSETPDPAGGTIGRLEDGSPSGLLEGRAAQQIKGVAPPPPL